jgi:hypothetical protein
MENTQNSLASSDSSPSPCSEISVELAANDGSWPKNLLARIKLPIPVRELADMVDGLSKRAKSEGKTAYMKQVGDCMEIYSVPNVSRQESPGETGSTGENK